MLGITPLLYSSRDGLDSIAGGKTGHPSEFPDGNAEPTSSSFNIANQVRAPCNVYSCSWEGLTRYRSNGLLINCGLVPESAIKAISDTVDVMGGTQVLASHVRSHDGQEILSKPYTKDVTTGRALHMSSQS